MKTIWPVLLLSAAAWGQSPGTAKQLTDAERQSLAAVRYVRAKLSDPASFRFSSVVAHAMERKDGSTAYAVCIDGSMHNPNGVLTPLVAYVLPPYQNDPMNALIGNLDEGSADGRRNAELYNAMCKGKKGDNTTNAVRSVLWAERR